MLGRGCGFIGIWFIPGTQFRFSRRRPKFIKTLTAIILDPSVDGKNNRTTAAGTWIVTLQDGSEISGTSTCSSTSGSWARAYPEYDFNTEETTGEHCWCRMLYPVRSAWVYDMITSGCSSNCAYTCGHHVNTISDFRRGVYTSAGN